MRTLMLLFSVLLISACVEPDPAFGTVTVATIHCHDPQTAYHSNNISNLDGLGLAAWRPQTDLSQTVDLTVSCDDFPSDCMDFHIQSACGTQAAGYFDLGTNTEHIDSARANGEFAFSGVELHEAIHYYINRGPHPERARLHICPCDMVNPECWTGGCNSDALMSPNLAGLGGSTASSWDGMVESLPGDLTRNTPTLEDQRFVRWAITP